MYYRSDILSSLRILDLTRIFTGPFASQILSDLGAEVIKIEPPRGDDTRYWGPPFVDKDRGISGYFAALNRNKTTVMIDLKTKKGYEKFVAYLKDADVIMENFRPGVVDKLEIDYSIVKEINPEIVYLSITGFGSGGEYQHHPSYDIIAQAESGVMSITGSEDGNYAKVGVPIGDISAGLYGVIGTLAALIKKEEDGKGRYVQTDLFSSLTSWLKYQSMNTFLTKDGTIPGPMGTSHPNIVPYQSFLCSDNESIVIAIGNDHLWAKFIEMIEEMQGLENHLLKSDQFDTNDTRVEKRDQLIPELQKIFLDFDVDTWLDNLRKYGLPAGRINSIDRVHTHPQLQYTKQLQTITDSENDGNEIKIFMTPISFSDDNKLSQKFPPHL